MDSPTTFHSTSTHPASQDSEALKDARSAKRHTEEHASRIAKLEFEVSKLSVVAQALWEMIKRDTNKSDELLITELEAVAASRHARTDVKLNCMSCGMSNAAHKKRCIYCGGTLPEQALEFPFI